MEMRLIEQRVEECHKCSGIGFKPHCDLCNDTKKIVIQIYAAPYEEPKPEAKESEQVV